jgi:hypothetical protein
MRWLAQLLDGDSNIIDKRFVNAPDWFGAREKASRLWRPRAANGILYPWHGDPMNRNIRVTSVGTHRRAA